MTKFEKIIIFVTFAGAIWWFYSTVWFHYERCYSKLSEFSFYNFSANSELTPK